MARLPGNERVHVVEHLPLDARALASPRPARPAALPLVTAREFELAVASASGLRGDAAAARVRAVLAALRTLVPEEVADVAAVLPQDLRDMWTQPAAATTS